MTSPTFEARLSGADIHCRVTVTQDLTAPVFCFSLMAPPRAGSGGRLIRSDGSYGEIQLPDLVAGEPHDFVVGYANPDYRPVNRAWLPLGAYLRTQAGPLPLPPLPAGVTCAAASDPPPPEGLGLLPPPTAWLPRQGTCAFTGLATQSAPWAAIDALAQRCQMAGLQDPDGLPTTVTASPDLPAGGYRIDLRSDGVDVQFADATGLHHAGISLLVLRELHSGALPCGLIEDHPRFAWRGQHLDCARHFYQIGTITRLLDLMALLKLNRFHWHFSDDEAFRLQLDSCPELAARTSMRGEAHAVPGVFGGGPEAGGSYSKPEAQQIIDHARGLCIEVLPEVEFPAHALAVARAFPDTRDAADTGRETSVQGYGGNVLNPALPATWDLLGRATREVGAMFPLGMVHLGADELPEGTWAGSPAVTQLKQDEGLAETDDVLGWALDRLAGQLAQQGIRTAAWEEAARGTNGGIGNNALLFSWTGQQAGIDAAQAGYDIVMCPAQNVYLDMAHTDAFEDWGAAWAAFVSLQDTIDWTVIPAPDIADRVVGVEGTFWSEFTTHDAEIEPMIAPRILGVAAKAWSVTEPIDASEFTRDAHSFCTLLTRMGWTWNTACFET